MIEEIGYLGSNSIMILGTRADIDFFFKTIDYDVISKHPEIDFSLVTDRLYKRYLRFEDLDKTNELMKFIGEGLKAVPASCVEWLPEEAIKEGRTNLDSARETVYDVFEAFFRCFEELVEWYKYNFDKYGEYGEPIMIARVSSFHYKYFEDLPLEYYDNLEGEPLWKFPLQMLHENWEKHRKK